MTDGYLSHDKAHVAAQQRARRARMVRIDYMPGRQALAVLQARQAKERPGSVAATNSATLDAILIEWAELTGLKWKPIDRPKGPAGHTGINTHLRAHARANDSGGNATRSRQDHGSAREEHRKLCGAKRHRDGQPCQARPEPGNRRCRFHGGRSTGPRTSEGMTRALANLRQYRSGGGEIKVRATGLPDCLSALPDL